MTPPPSTQVPQRISSPLSPVGASDGPALVARTPTPPTSLLSSPPPTASSSLAVKTDAFVDDRYDVPTPAQIADASSANLRTFLLRATNEIQQLRTTAAHHKLQHTLLTIETDEAAKRMEVEHEMTRREVEVLQMADQTPRQHPAHGSDSPRALQRSESSARLTAELRQYGVQLQTENTRLKQRMKKAKKVIQHRDEEVAALSDENQRLRKRIKENREHVNRLRHAGGVYDSGASRRVDHTPATPARNIIRPPSGFPGVEMTTGATGGEDTFAALLLAGQFNRQGPTPEPLTPVRQRLQKPVYMGHHRGSHSLSSLPSTPRQPAAMTPNSSGLLPPLSITPMAERAGATPVRSGGEKHRRRQSRDSTISASDAGATPRNPYQDETEDDDTIPESQASQLATNLLRRASAVKAETRPEAPPDAVITPASKTNGRLQAKLFSKVTKPNLQEIFTDGRIGGKRKAEDDVMDQGRDIQARKAKKLRTDEGVGLGIGEWGSPRV
ncbi:MAG: hypothetical protein M1838_004659 [Thelocarpon superellum]|nr:MAG: hypothetical protein M1838_004659 [Thelocarpon superellum]